LGELHLERGETLEAAACFERLLSRPDADAVLTPRVLYKAAVALKRSGDARHAVPLRQVQQRLNQAMTRDNGLVLGRRTLAPEQVQQALDQPVIAVKPAAGLGDWSMRYGNAAHCAVADGGAPFLHAAFTLPMLDPERAAGGRDNPSEKPSDADAPIQAELERVYNARRGVALPGFFPVATPDAVVFRTYDGVYAYSTKPRKTAEGRLVPAGTLLWWQWPEFSTYNLLTTGGRGMLYPNAEIKPKATGWWDAYKVPMNAPGILFENPLQGTLAHDGRYVYFVDDVGIPPPPTTNDPTGLGQSQQAQAGELGKAVTAGALYAVDLNTGAIKWNIGRLPLSSRYAGADPAAPKAAPPPPLTEDEADQTADVFRLCAEAIFLGPPLPLNGRLYVLIEQAGVMRVLCLDPYALVKTKDSQHPVPTLLWSQKLGRAGNVVAAEPHRRYQGAFLAAGEGVLVCPTNSGAVVGIDLMSRSLLWARAYRKIEPTAAPSAPGQPVGPGVMRTNALTRLADSRWHAAAPVVAGGRVILTAYDSQRLECLDLRTGTPVWEVPRDADDLYLGGVANGKVIVVGRTKVRAYSLNDLDPPAPKATVPSPKLAWNGSEPIPTPTGHGVVGRNLFFVPVRQENAGSDSTTPVAEIWGVDVDTGRVASKTVSRSDGEDPKAMEELARYGLGNLAYQDGMVFAQSAWQVSAYPQLDVKKAEMDKLLAANPNDPKGLHERGMILLDDGQVRAAIADFKSAEENNPPEELRAKIKTKLFVAFTELLRADFAAGEPFLAEYEALCDLPPDATEKQNRRRLYRYLLAKGREKQGRLVDAFDQYLELATLGADRLQPDPDDPGVKVRADVWARGRIEGMVRRTTDPAGRKALEDRVAREWDAVKGGTDLARLRSFVAVFGPYFPVGFEAELTLAETLLKTNNEADAREAQMHLAHLRASAEPPALRARATETLARLMVRSGQMEDAVALYLQLGREHPDVVVRDGKTGSDFLTELLTDKRLLPYLEPAHYPVPARVKAEQLGPLPSSQMGPVFEIEPEGDLFQAYRRIRFVVDLTGAGGPGWTIRGFDRVTGLQKYNFGGLQQPPISEPGTVPFSKFFKGSGHLVLFQLGTWVYCFDLAEPPNKERWRRNLLTDPPPGVAQTYTVQVTPTGDVVALLQPDATQFGLLNRFVIQPGYCALNTQDGLEVFDPLAKDKQLWVRRGMPERVALYGDARNLLLLEQNASRQPTGTRLLRAVDGMAVDGAADAGRLLQGAGAYRVNGRTVLLTEGGGDAPRTVRLVDLAAGTDVWKKQYPAKSLYLNSPNPDWTGAVLPDGTVEVLDADTGKPVTTLKLGRGYPTADPLDGASEGLLLADRERFYVVIDRDAAGAAARPTTRVYSYSLRTQRVNGPLFCFDRASGRRLWFLEGVLDNQALVMDQFADLPVLVAAAPVLEPNARFPVYRIVVVQKDEGVILYNEGATNNGYVFQNLS
ncbi:MAG: PQQ-like beta-propeller repeat protein, partial [Gemmataceae bacterium]|nr:PQQ-like beta-propeller repeat protein [Gemmataceae bacterium]